MMHDNFDEMYKAANTPEAIAAIDELWAQAKSRRGGVKYLGQDGTFNNDLDKAVLPITLKDRDGERRVYNLSTPRGKRDLMNFIKVEGGSDE